VAQGRVAVSLSLALRIFRAEFAARTQLFWFITALNNSINHSGAGRCASSFNSHSADCLAAAAIAGVLNSGVWIFSARPDTETTLHRTHSERERGQRLKMILLYMRPQHLRGSLSLFCRWLIALARPDEVIMNYSWKRDACSPQLIFRRKSVFIRRLSARAVCSL
jgi:hypothetical protein